MRRFFLICSFYAAVTMQQAQDLPIWMTPDEKAQMPFVNYPYGVAGSREYNKYFLPPAATNLRNMAEWEEVGGYMVTYTSYKGMVRDIIKHGKKECRMYVVTDNVNNTINDLNNAGIDTVNVTFLVAPYNSVWIRDYGPNMVYLNRVDSLVFVDWIYNRPTRTKDDTIPLALAKNMQIPVFMTTQAPYNLVATGGNWMSDGMGTAFSSELIIDENKASGGFGVNHTEAEIDSIVKKFMGIHRYIKMETLPYDGIHHIDMHMKLLDEETLLVGEYPQGISDGPQIEANLQYVLNNFKTGFGTDWRIFRIPMPDDGGLWPSNGGDYLTYTNASFINKTIIVPTYNVPEDTTALRIWREACPGYNVVGINSTASIPAGGALHCITHEVGVRDPLLITHQRLRDTYNTSAPYKVTANILHRSGIQSATLYYTTDTNTAYQSMPMSLGPNGLYEANIPAQPAGTEVFYYIRAQANSGKQQVRPITAPAGFYNFKVLSTASNPDTHTPVTEVLNPFPNPSKGITCLPVNTASSHPISIAIYNTLGEKVQTVYEGYTKPGDNKFFINTLHFTAGVYYIRYKIAESETVKTLLVR
ncbi:MAG: agmatine deiminase family protein [Chitinophagales bacterium]|nr:agmatine deiminase family protein [Chitinophagales bacterium]MDW8419064.1 agmatine deiminase family protein [Chitinophagales bacterium]